MTGSINWAWKICVTYSVIQLSPCTKVCGSLYGRPTVALKPIYHLNGHSSVTENYLILGCKDTQG